MSCFETELMKTLTPDPDPTKHVRYVQGMVLGVDDFVQEFAYLSERDQWALRELAGYGTVRGLAVIPEANALGGPSLRVTAGAAVSPRGAMICVPRDQCASLNPWLSNHAKKVFAELGPAGQGTLTLYVVLGYADCTTDAVPIPGEPCRSEDRLKADSRIKDDFSLDLSFEPPRQREADAVRDFLRWLRQIPVGGSIVTSTPLEDFLAELRNAATPWLGSPPCPGGSPAGWDYMYGSPPASLQIAAADVCHYLRAALRLWVTKLRPAWHGRSSGCAPAPCMEDEKRVLLARADVPVRNDGGVPVVDDAGSPPGMVRVSDDDRPFLLHGQFLQEWLACYATEPGSGASVASPPVAAGPYVTVAAGQVLGDPDNLNGRPIYNGLKVVRVKDGELVFWFNGYDPACMNPGGTFQYIVKALVAAPTPGPAVVQFGEFLADGFLVLVPKAKADAIRKLEFMIEVSRYDAAL